MIALKIQVSAPLAAPLFICGHSLLHLLWLLFLTGFIKGTNLAILHCFFKARGSIKHLGFFVSVAINLSCSAYLFHTLMSS